MTTVPGNIWWEPMTLKESLHVHIWDCRKLIFDAQTIQRDTSQNKPMILRFMGKWCLDDIWDRGMGYCYVGKLAHRDRVGINWANVHILWTQTRTARTRWYAYGACALFIKIKMSISAMVLLMWIMKSKGLTWGVHALQRGDMVSLRRSLGTSWIWETSDGKSFRDTLRLILPESAVK